MENIVYYRLEYNEKQGCFRFDPIAVRKDDRYGWETISMVIRPEEINAFIESVLKEFPNINSGKETEYPNAVLIKKRFNAFMGLSEL
jgi:hypothetical protein